MYCYKKFFRSNNMQELCMTASSIIYETMKNYMEEFPDLTITLPSLGFVKICSNYQYNIVFRYLRLMNSLELVLVTKMRSNVYFISIPSLLKVTVFLIMCHLAHD